MGTSEECSTNHWGILTKSPALVDIVGPHPQLVARRARNLKGTLVHSEYARTRAKKWLTDLKVCMHVVTAKCANLLTKL